jgi:hypothetical protein
MADSDKNIVITPNRSQTAQPTIVFTGKGNVPITLKLLDDSNGTMSFEGSSGQLFSINNNLASGTIFSVNDISGVPMIDVDASGLVRLAPLGGTTYSNTLYGVPRTVAGSGNSVTIRAADGLTSGAGGSIILQPGQQATTGGNGVVVVRQPGGTAGTDELQIYHDGTHTYFANKDTSGNIYFDVPTGSNPGLFIRRSDFTTQSLKLTAGDIDNLATVQSVSADMQLRSGSGDVWIRPGTASNYVTNWFALRLRNLNGQNGAILRIPGNNPAGILQLYDNADSSGGSIAYPAATPTTLAANTNDLVLNSSAIQRLSASAAYNLTGIAPPATASHADGRVIWLHNVGSFNITLKHSQSSVAGNQFINENGGDIVLGPNRIVQCTYDGTSTKWRVHGEMYPYNLPTADGTSGQVLSTNGSGTLSWTTASGGLGGSGTTNYIVKFTGSTTAGNSQIFDNGTNVGIGTASPNSKVTIGADFASITGMTIDTGNGTDSGLVMRKAASKTAMGFLPWDSDAYITAGVYYDGGAWVHHNANNNNQLFVMSPGTGISWYASNNGTGSWNVANGITLWNDAGTWRQPVDAVGTGGSTVNALGTALIRVSPSSQNTYAALELRTLNAGTYGGAGLMAVNDTNYDSNLVFYTNPAGSTTRAERMRIHKNGDIGIAIGGKIAQGLGFAGNASATSYNYIDLYNGTTGELGLRTVGSFPLICYTANTERLRIDSSGNVGIGTASPSTKLHVVGAVRSSGYSGGGDGTYLALTGDLPGYSANTYPTLRSDGSIYFAASDRYSAYLYSVDNSFNICNTSTQWRVRLHPNGTSYFTGGSVAFGDTAATGGGQVYVAPTSAGTKGLVVRAAATPTANILEVQNSSGTNLVYVDPTGDLVVGSLSAGTFPTGALAPLHVTRSTTAVSTAIAAWPTAEPETQTHARVVAYMSDGGNGGTATVGTGTTNIVQFGEYYTGRVVLMPLGAGSGTPADQNSGAGRDIMLLGGKSDNSAGKTGGRVFIQGGTGFAGAYGTNFGNVVLQANGGNVGVAVTSPQSTLDVRGMTIITNNSGSNYNENLRLPESSSGYATIHMGGSVATTGTGANQWSILKTSAGLSHRFEIRHNTSQYFAITTAGAVGINETSPGAQLQVNTGAAATKGLIIKGAASQSANLTEWVASDGVVTGQFSPDSVLTVGRPEYGTIYVGSYYPGFIIDHFSRSVPSTVGNYVELFRTARAGGLPITLRVSFGRAGYRTVQKVYRLNNSLYDADKVIIPEYSTTGTEYQSGAPDDDFELEVATYDTYNQSFRLRRTVSSGVAVTADIGLFAYKSYMSSSGGITKISGTGTSSISLTNWHATPFRTQTITGPVPAANNGAGTNLSIAASSGAGTGAGGSLFLYGGSGATTGAGGSIILQPGLQATSGGNGIVVVRQPSGTAGTDEIQLSHDGGKGSIINKDGTLQLGGANIAIRNSANNANTTLTATAIYATSINSNNSVNSDGVTNDSYSWAIDGSSLNWNSSFNIRVSWSHIKGYGGAGMAYVGDGTNNTYATLHITDGGSNGGSLAYRATNVSITANTNNLTPSTFSAMQRWSSTANYNVTGFSPGGSTSFGGGTPTWIHASGRVIWVHNVGSYNITLKHEDANSTAANRFTNETGTDLILPPNSMVMLTYDSTTTRWRVHTLSNVVTNSSSTTNISAATNNLALSGSNFQRMNCTVACNLTGIAPPSGGTHYDGRTMRLYNTGTANLTLKHNSTSSDIANRFCCVQAVDIILAPRDYAELIWDGTDGGLVAGQNNPCWRVA